MAKNSWALPDGYDAATRKALNELFGSLKNANTHITPEAYEELRRGNTQAFMGLVNWQAIGADFATVQDALRKFASKTGLQLYTGGEIYSELLFDLVDEKAVIWAKNHTADLVTEITDEMRQQIRDVMAEATQGELTYSQAARKIKTNLALTTKDSAAVDSYYSKQLDKLTKSGLSIDKATAKATARADRYAAKLLRNRSRAIARTEIANAASEGRKISWETGVADGYIDPASLKEWVAESDACEICGPMDGVTVPYNKDFPSGVMMPPQHPNCRCAAVLLPPEYNDDYWTAYAKDSTIDASVTIQKTADNSYKPTQGMVTAAERALRWNDEGKAKGAGTAIGWGRATDIAAGRSMSLDIVKRMFSYFSRHEVDKQGKDFKNISNPSNGRIMWDAWGGDAGFTWSKAIVEREKKLEKQLAHKRTSMFIKHLKGQHDQTSHGNRGGGRQNYATATDLFNNQKSIEDAVNSRTNTGQSQFQNGAVATQVLLESQGRGGKPQVFEGDETKTSMEALKEANPDAVFMFRGTDADYKNSMLNDETDRTGTGVFGDGYYFTDDFNEAQNYASRGLTGRHANPATVVAALSPTAKVKTFKNLDEIASFGKGAQNEALKNISFETGDFTLSQFYSMHTTAATTKLILEGFDAMRFQGYNDSTFTVVFDRGALQVAAS